MPKPANDFVCHYPRGRRPPLTYWSEKLVESLQGRAPKGLNEYKNSASLLNKAALVFAYLGEQDKARQICEAELVWLANEADGLNLQDSAHLLRLAIDPWVNMGRLLGFQGNAKNALEYFAAVHSLNSSAQVHLGPCRLTSQIWKKVLESHPHMNEVTRSIYVIDSLKTLLQSQDYRGVLEFIKALNAVECAAMSAPESRALSNAVSSPGLRYLVNEGALIAKLRLGSHGEIAANARPSLIKADAYYESVLMLYRAEIDCAEGTRNGSQISKKLAILVKGGLFDSVPPATMLRFIEKHGDLLEQVEERKLALGVYKKGLALARRLNDQIYEWEFLRALRRLAVSEEQQAEWDHAHRRLVGVCEYKVVCKAEGVTPAPSGSGRIHDKLLDAAMGLVGAK
ncbi:hypothetical protein ACFWG6_39060 [Streptomyces erythrochromogenes]|uniref:hypothetical protein n=1 Tax=Streptomyces erythrochromogenes TaxID=285574 RepID=UPI00362F8445